jgi:hypothetical protein
MREHTLILTCEGRTAGHGRLDAADIPDLTEGAKWLLTTSAHFYTVGRVPRNTVTKTRHFCVEGGSPGGRPWSYTAWIRIFGSDVYDVNKYTFRDHLLSTLAAWQKGGTFQPPEFLEIQPLLHASGRLNSPICDNEPLRELELLRLSERTSRAMDFITRPVGTSAAVLQLAFDGVVVMSFDRRSREWELAEYSRRTGDHKAA